MWGRSSSSRALHLSRSVSGISWSWGIDNLEYDGKMFIMRRPNSNVKITFELNEPVHAFSLILSNVATWNNSTFALDVLGALKTRPFRE